MFGGEVYGLTIDADESEVSVHYGFSGGEITVFGSVKKGHNVALVILGPRESVRFYEKRRVFGLWVNKLVGRVDSVPSFYGFFMNNGFLGSETKADESLLHFYEIGFKRLRFLMGEGILLKDRSKIISEMIKIRASQGLYFEEDRGVKIVNGDLFKVKIRFPKETPTGVFRIKVLTFDEEDVLRQTRVIPIFVRKRGLVSFIAHSAKLYPVWYGLSVVLLSLSVGLLVVFILHRRT
jgi:uncharacterized protein (TIGR02186 family)